ncbi:MAG: hypothetical protein RLZZ15_2947 [Verrucomicrobiota bacterium]
MSSITCGELARRLNLAPSTVSMALRGHPRIAAATRSRVTAAAKAADYRPDPALSALAERRWRGQKADFKIALLAQRGGAPEGTVERLVAAAERRAHELGFICETCPTDEFRHAGALDALLYRRGVEGLVIGPCFRPGATLGLAWDRYASVGCGRGGFPPRLDLVAGDVFEAVRLAWEHCERAGARRIGAALFSLHPEAIDDRLRRAAVLERQAAGAAVVPIHTGPPLDRGAFLRWFEAERPDAVIAMHAGVFFWLHEAGVKMPHDVRFVSLGEPTDLSWGIAHTRIDRTAIAALAVDHLALKLRRGEHGLPAQRQLWLLEPEWVPGASLSAPAPAAAPFSTSLPT